MDKESFDTFDVPPFTGFTKDLDESDEFFDVRHETTDEKSKRKFSDNDKISELNDSAWGDSEHLFSTNNISSEQSSTLDILEELEIRTKHMKIRRSLSVGNMILFGEQQRSENNEDKFKRPRDTHIMSPCKEERKTPKVDHVYDFSHSKRFTSHENLRNSTKFVSMAEAVNRFQRQTPERFRSKPDKYQQPSKHHWTNSRTIPQSPALSTKARSRPTTGIMTHEEKEQMEFEKINKQKIKANPVNHKILQGPSVPAVVVPKKEITIPEPFKLTTVPKKVNPSPKKYQFHANPIPKPDDRPKRIAEIKRKELTKPITPSFMKRYKPPTMPQTGNKLVPQRPEQKKLTKTVLQPFSFESRDKMVQKRREQQIIKILEQERRAREFHANPVPKKIYQDTRGSKSTLPRSNCSAGSRGSSTEHLNLQFKARPPTVLYKEPFVPAKVAKPLTQPEPFHLSGEERQLQREKFKMELKKKEEYLEELKRIELEERLKKEAEEVAELRKKAVWKAQPIKKYKELVIHPSGKVTEPITPIFLSKGSRRNKENIADNSM